MIELNADEQNCKRCLKAIYDEFDTKHALYFSLNKKDLHWRIHHNSKYHRHRRLRHCHCHSKYLHVNGAFVSVEASLIATNHVTKSIPYFNYVFTLILVLFFYFYRNTIPPLSPFTLYLSVCVFMCQLLHILWGASPSICISYLVLTSFDSITNFNCLCIVWLLIKVVFRKNLKSISLLFDCLNCVQRNKYYINCSSFNRNWKVFVFYQKLNTIEMKTTE